MGIFQTSNAGPPCWIAPGAAAVLVMITDHALTRRRIAPGRLIRAVVIEEAVGAAIVLAVASPAVAAVGVDDALHAEVVDAEPRRAVGVFQAGDAGPPRRIASSPAAVLVIVTDHAPTGCGIAPGRPARAVVIAEAVGAATVLAVA